MRRPVVSRTFNMMETVVLCINTDNNETIEMPISFTRAVSSDKIVIRRAKKMCESNLIPVKVLKAETKKVRMEMSEEDFIANAHIVEE